VADRYELGSHRGQGLVDILDRILDKGLVIAGDITISLANVELLTIQIRLMVCSIDKAEQIGMNWWRTDPHYSKPVVEAPQLRLLTERLEALTERLEKMERKQVKK
jgi:hypothetical protein